MYKFLVVNTPNYKLEEPKLPKIDLGEAEKDEPLIELSAPSK